MKTKFSIIIPLYNNEKYICKCINSILFQKYSNYEIIIIDDGSTDNSLSIVKAEYSKNNKISIISKKNSGVSETRNYGIEKATSDWITFIDSDDWVEPNFLYKVNKLIELNKNVDFVQLNIKQSYSFEKNNIKNVLYDKVINHTIVSKKEKEDYIKSIISINYYGGKRNKNKYGNCRCIGGKFYKTNLIKKNSLKFNKNLKIFEDGIFNLNYLRYSKIIVINSEKDYCYRINNNSATNSINKNSLETINNIIEELYKYRIYSTNYDDSILCSISDLIIYCVKNISKSTSKYAKSKKSFELILKRYSNELNSITKSKEISTKAKIVSRLLLNKLFVLIFIYYKNKLQYKKGFKG